jgi:DNA-binding XRE family transcriptional regulator
MKGYLNLFILLINSNFSLHEVFILKIYFMPRETLINQNNQIHRELCTFLRELRLNNGYTQAQVANEIHLSRNSISKIERMGFFRIQHLYLLADFYDIPICTLFPG